MSTASDNKPAKGSIKRRVRKGRGNASGKGGESGRGHKGQKSRSGYSRKAGFEGGQMPLYRRVPKKPGFKNKFKTLYVVINVGSLNERCKDNDTIDEKIYGDLFGAKQTDQIKILGQGDLTKKLKIKAHKFSKTAIEKVEKAGGSVEILT